eukprot:TRINITY_DN13028_c0_g1_i1.p1 TRINITY_DN13028_c0_g1~~TRINITY_DN13028_c0_g1_i1.p1  ORF type:complete len:133 (+),score=31.75 TRINITY_DN13028_c0_g1_i1:205-603(+)
MRTNSTEDLDGRVLFIGPTDAGKASLIRALDGKDFESARTSSASSSPFNVTTHAQGLTLLLVHPGGVRFTTNNVRAGTYENAGAIVLVFNMNDPDSFEEMRTDNTVQTVLKKNIAKKLILSLIHISEPTRPY